MPLRFRVWAKMPRGISTNGLLLVEISLTRILRTVRREASVWAAAAAAITAIRTMARDLGVIWLGTWVHATSQAERNCWETTYRCG